MEHVSNIPPDQYIFQPECLVSPVIIHNVSKTFYSFLPAIYFFPRSLSTSSQSPFVPSSLWKKRNRIKLFCVQLEMFIWKICIKKEEGGGKIYKLCVSIQECINVYEVIVRIYKEY